MKLDHFREIYKHISPSQLAKEINYSSTYISNVAHGRRQSSQRFLDALDAAPCLRQFPNQDLASVDEPLPLDFLEKQVLDLVRRRKVPPTVGDISREIDRSSETVIKLIDSLNAKHYEVKLDDLTRQITIPVEPSKHFEPTPFKYYQNKVTIGVVADSHLCSRWQQLTLLHDAYKIFDERQTDFNIHAGDLVDGNDMYRGHREELFVAGAESQRKYAVEHYPRSKRKRKTYVIGGQHDYSFMKQNGYNIVSHICEERDDLVYRGFYKTEFQAKDTLLQVQHPGGGSSYARSYRVQKIAESFIGHTMGIVRNSPDRLAGLPVVVFYGHWHIAFHLPLYMGMDSVALPCFQAQTIYLQQKGLQPDVGCVIAEIWLNENGQLGSTKIEFINMNGQTRENDW